MNSVFIGARRNLASLLDVLSRPLPATGATRWVTLVAAMSIVVLTGLLLASSARAEPPEPPPPPSSQRLADVEKQLAQARKRLDEAALELARLHESVEVSAHKKGGGRAMLGVLIDDPDRRDGVFIAGVTPGGGAAAAGLRSGDVLVAINDDVMNGSKGHPHSHISRIMKEVTPGKTVTVRYLRNGNEAQAKIVTQASGHYAASLAGLDDERSRKQRIEIDMDCFQPEALLQELSDSLGIDFDDGGSNQAQRLVSQAQSDAPYLVDLNEDLASYFDTDSGVLVVRPPAGNSSLKAGDLLDQVAGKPVANVQDALAMLQLSDADRPIKLQVIRQGKARGVTIDPGLLNAPDTRVIRISGDDGDLRIELSRTPTGRTNLAP